VALENPALGADGARFDLLAMDVLEPVAQPRAGREPLVR
jgi:hypothetical protein